MQICYKHITSYPLQYSINAVIHSYNLAPYYTIKSRILHLTHMPKCPSRPPLHFSSICMSKAAESLKGNQPRRQSLGAEYLPGAAEAPSAFGEKRITESLQVPYGRRKELLF